MNSEREATLSRLGRVEYLVDLLKSRASSSITAITGRSPIVIGGTATNPNITIVSNIGSIYDQSPTSLQGSGGPTIIALIQAVVKGSGIFRFSAKGQVTCVAGDQSTWALTTQMGTGVVTTTGGSSTGTSNGIIPTGGVALISSSVVAGTGIAITGGSGLNTQTLAQEVATIAAASTLVDKFSVAGITQNGNNGPFTLGNNAFLILSYTNNTANRQLGDIGLSFEEV